VYAAGVALFGLALGAPLVEQLRLHAEPKLRDLTARTGETTMLSVRVDLGMMTVAQVESPQPMRLSFLPGTIHPLHAGATATLLLAYESPEVVRRVLERPLERFTPDTITDAEQLIRRLAEIRSMGYAVSHGEADAHATAVAAPVLYNGRILCALTVAGPSTRFGSARVRDYAELLVAATRELSQRLRASDG
jgi:DNA-binding IclR family transcriptional regulator